MLGQRPRGKCPAANNKGVYMSEELKTGDRCLWETTKKRGGKEVTTKHRGAVDYVKGDYAFVKEIGSNLIVKVPVNQLQKV